ncbi:carboxynorspermidine decarboxylase [Desulfovibrio sp. OttesenSCG-928-I05]|nr:carboxynorspermidine decarboxylase [Desulfovibrio sp. OttesenSCG-928-I05]
MSDTPQYGSPLSPSPRPWHELPLDGFPSPCFVVDETRLAANLAVLDQVQRRTKAHVFLALKGFAMFNVFPLLRRVLAGTCASSPHEARMGREEFGGIVHSFAAGFSHDDIVDIVRYSDHLVFNSFDQYRRFRSLALAEAGGRKLDFGIRINPEHSEGAVAIYNPCSPGSRLGVRPEAFAAEAVAGALEGISGLHFHTLCQQNADALARTVEAVEASFGKYLAGLKWINCGGGHHVSRADYNVDLLCDVLTRLHEKYGAQIIIEPGEAVALNAGVLKCTVLDIVRADMDIAILDTSAAAHMPDVLEMPYRPDLLDPEGNEAGLPGEKARTYRLAGKSCLAGDVIGEYSFDRQLNVGDVLLFLDMAHYSMVKTTTFNGLGLPAIAKITEDGEPVLVREFGYEEFRRRLS